MTAASDFQVPQALGDAGNYFLSSSFGCRSQVQNPGSFDYKFCYHFFLICNIFYIHNMTIFMEQIVWDIVEPWSSWVDGCSLEAV